MWFKYVACNPAGRMASGVLEAPSERDAEKTLWRSDLTIVTLNQKRGGRSLKEQFPTLFGVKQHDVIYFTRDLATLLSSGIGILPALNMLRGRMSKVSMKKVTDDVSGAVESGSTFSEACSRHPEAFSPFFIRMVKVGEEVGNLELMLKQVATQMEKEMAVKRKVSSAMMYPSFVLLIATVAVFALLYFVIPAMDVLFSQIGGRLPTITVVVLAVANFLQANILFIMLGIFVIIAFYWWYRRTNSGKKVLGELVLKIPIIGKVVLIASMTQISRNIAVMIHGGITLTECLDLIVETTENVPLRRALEKVRTAVHSGESLSGAVAIQKVFPPLFSQVISVGESSGRLETNLEVLADFYEVEGDRAVGRATGMLSPILVVCCGLMVGLIALAIYTPIYSLMGQLGGK